MDIYPLLAGIAGIIGGIILIRVGVRGLSRPKRASRASYKRANKEAHQEIFEDDS